MIEIKNTEVLGWEAAIRGMRNPMNSWDKSDSYSTRIENKRTLNTAKFEFFVGENDLKLMKNLVKAGSDHSKFMRYIIVSCDIIAPLYWWKEYDTYKIGTVANSCSTMHKIHEKPIGISDFSIDKLNCDVPDCFYDTLDCLNESREKFLETGDKKYWYRMIQLLPSSYNQMRTVILNYAVLRNMYHARKNHKLDEWRNGFCEWVEGLPYSELITE